MHQISLTTILSRSIWVVRWIYLSLDADFIFFRRFESFKSVKTTTYRLIMTTQTVNAWRIEALGGALNTFQNICLTRFRINPRQLPLQIWPNFSVVVSVEWRSFTHISFFFFLIHPKEILPFTINAEIEKFITELFICVLF